MVNVNRMRENRPGFDPRLFLRDEELDYGIALMLAGERALLTAARDLAGEINLPQQAARALIAIRFDPGQTVTELREHLGMTTPTLARLLGELDQRGLIERQKAERGDGRARQVYLTHEGKRATDAATLAMRDRLREAYRKAGPSAVAGARAMLEALR